MATEKVSEPIVLDSTLKEAVLELEKIRKRIGGSDISDEIKETLLACFEHVAWVDDQGQQYYDSLRDALYASKTVVSISAAFEQGSAVIYDTATLDELKQYLTVTATYDDGTSAVVTNYTLSGTLTAGTSTITVSYGGQTATFDVSVTHYSDPDLLYTLPSTFVSTGTSSIDTGVSIVKEEEYTIFGTCTITQLDTNARFVFGTQHGDSGDYFSICCSNIPQGQADAGTHLWGNGIAFGTDTNFIADNDTVKFVSIITSTSSMHQRTTYAKNVTKSTSLSGTREYQNVTAFKGYNVFLGAQQTVGTNGFIGSISDFSIVNRIATQAEINAYLGA